MGPQGAPMVPLGALLGGMPVRAGYTGSPIVALFCCKGNTGLSFQCFVSDAVCVSCKAETLLTLVDGDLSMTAINAKRPV